MCSLLSAQIECMVATEMMQRYKKLQFERGESSPNAAQWVRRERHTHVRNTSVFPGDGAERRHKRMTTVLLGHVAPDLSSFCSESFTHCGRFCL